MKTVVITGATGFVGTALCHRMLQEKCSVRGTIRTAPQAASLPKGVVPVLISSIGPNTDWSAALAGVDTVVHLAARVHVMKDSSGDPLTAYRLVNVAGTEKLARQAAAHGVRRLVYLSSVKVNGEETSAPYKEEDCPAPQDPYGISKWEAEGILQRIAAETGLEVVIIRPPLVYGPGVKANFLKLLKFIDLGVPMPFSSIDNRRSMIYLGNLIDAIIICATHPKAAGQIYLVSDGEDMSTPLLIRQVATALGRRARLIPFPPSLMRILGKLLGKSSAIDRLLSSLVVDNNKIRRELGWNPPFTTSNGLKETAGWFKKQS